MKILSIDIETSPNLAYVWGLWDQNIPFDRIQLPTEMLCWSAKWMGKGKVISASSYVDSEEEFLNPLWKLMDEADVIMHYYGKRFDVPHIQREFVEAKMNPPSPFRQIDLQVAVHKQFKFPSYKLEYVANALGIGHKMQHEGFPLWDKCMKGDPDAWARMLQYNKQDVRLVEKLYARILPWIPSLPSFSPFAEEDVCPACGSKNLTLEGYAYTQSGKYQRYHCGGCGKWSRSSKRSQGSAIVQVAG